MKKKHPKKTKKNKRPNLIYLQKTYAKEGPVYVAYSPKSGRVREVVEGKDMDRLLKKVEKKKEEGEDLVLAFIPQYRKIQV